MAKLRQISGGSRAGSVSSYDIVVVGAGPYGLSTASHLRAAGLNVAVFGEPLQLWRSSMPEDMLLRSFWWASGFSDPSRRFNIERYFESLNQQPLDPLPARFVVEYGLWFQEHVVPDVNKIFVRNIRQFDKGFLLALDDDSLIHCSTVIMAPGLCYYTYCPIEYSHIRPELISHSSAHRTFARFKGKRLVIIGGGQSALETAAIAHESGALVQIVSRKSIHWITEPPALPEHRSLMERLRNPKAGIAPGWFNWALEHFPYVFQQLPRSIKDRLLSGLASYGPMGAHWLKPRVAGKIPLHEQVAVQRVEEVNDEVVLTLSNNESLHGDHIILCTGYRMNVHKLPMLDESVFASLQTYNDAPILNNHFESNIPGLYFVGFSSVSSCGPLYRFLVGTEACAKQVARSVVKTYR